MLVALAAPLIAASAWPTFAAVSTAWRVSFRHHASPTPEKFSTRDQGIGGGDHRHGRDGLLDLYFVNGAKLDGLIQSAAAPRKTSPDCWNRLFVQRAGNTFLGITESTVRQMKAVTARLRLVVREGKL